MHISYAGVLRPSRFAATVLIAFLVFGALGYAGWNGRSQKILSWSVAGKVIVIDPGHGGIDPGAVGPNKVLEKDINLSIAKRLKEYVQQGGGTAIMIREEDIDLSSTATDGLLQKKREDLAKRLAIAEEAKADLYLSLIHI